MDFNIIVLTPANFHKCANIWNMEQQADLAKRFYKELTDGNRVTYVYQDGEEYFGEISLVFEMNDSDYTIPGKRIYVSHLIVKPCMRHKGIGRTLVNHVIERAKDISYSEMTIGVDLDNYPAMKLYVDSGFNQIISIGKDEHGKFVKLLKQL